jgi:hypothetical protein
LANDTFIAPLTDGKLTDPRPSFARQLGLVLAATRGLQTAGEQGWFVCVLGCHTILLSRYYYPEPVLSVEFSF